MSEIAELNLKATSRVGKVLHDKWQLLRLIGVGGSAAVYEARHRNGRRVAIKMLHDKHADNQSAQKRFLQEAYAANRVSHPGIVQVHDDGADEDGTAFLVIELLLGQSVADLQRQAGGGLGPSTAARLIVQALEAVGAAHARGVVHRDLKPANLFVTESGALKVLDFGIARMTERPNGASLQTVSGTWLGTPAFAAPEQARGRWDEVDERSDVWALGATLFTLLTGHLVYEAETPNEQLGLAMTTPARSLAALGAFPPALVRVVDRALAFEQADRFASAADMSSALQAAAAGLSDVPVAIAKEVRTGRRSLGSRPALQLSTLGNSALQSRLVPPAPTRSGRWALFVAAAAVPAVVLIGQGYLRSSTELSAVPSALLAPAPVEEVSRAPEAAVAPPPAAPTTPEVVASSMVAAPSSAAAPAAHKPASARLATPSPAPRPVAATPSAPRAQLLDIRD